MLRRTRVLIVTLCVVAVALGVARLVPGTITVEWLGYQVETSTLLGALAIVVRAACCPRRAAQSAMGPVAPKLIAAAEGWRAERRRLCASNTALASREGYIAKAISI
jgi:hypothetical protein